MRNALLNLLENDQPISFEQVMLRLFAAALLGLAIYVSYWLSHSGTLYSRKFNVSLVMLTVITATVMIVIGNNVALSLGMVGALSIVRYRTAIKDSRDTAYIFWTIVSGICCGAGDYVTACSGSVVIFVLLLLMGRIKNDDRCLLVVRADRALERRIEALVFETFQKRSVLKSKNSSADSIEFIFEVPRKVYERQQNAETSLLDKLYDLGRVDYVNVVAQTDDIA